ncbi:unnamed protein product [Paramecium sonneborni]|uniref:Uncharacterized protein n=1 Tax=Paramecium sonneborni TaxID=65129 RepID=A0A8S1NI04_9CILI|nr:unnamed protein product [Paramecium sonneborni]
MPCSCSDQNGISIIEELGIQRNINYFIKIFIRRFQLNMNDIQHRNHYYNQVKTMALTDFLGNCEFIKKMLNLGRGSIDAYIRSLKKRNYKNDNKSIMAAPEKNFSINIKWILKQKDQFQITLMMKQYLLLQRLSFRFSNNLNQLQYIITQSINF